MPVRNRNCAKENVSPEKLCASPAESVVIHAKDSFGGSGTHTGNQVTLTLNDDMGKTVSVFATMSGTFYSLERTKAELRHSIPLFYSW